MRPSQRNSLGRDFGLLWTGQSISQVGSFVTVVALPLAAIDTLHATPFEVGVLTAMGFLGALIFGLPIGAVIERHRRRPVMIGSDAARFVLMLAIPLAAVADHLSISLLYLVALLGGTLSIAFDVAYSSYLPSLVGREHLIRANTRLEASTSVAAVAAPALGGFLVQLLTPPFALLFDAGSFVVSALSLSAIRKPEPAPPQRAPQQPAPQQPVPAPAEPERRRIRADVADGLRVVLTDPILRATVACTATMNVFAAAFDAVVLVFLARTIGLPSGVIGILLSAGGVGGVLGALAAVSFVRRFGDARSIWLSLVVTGPFGLLIPLTGSGIALSFYFVGEFVRVVGIIIFNITNGSFGQAYAAPEMIGRVMATRRVLARSALAVGALGGGSLATLFGTREALWIAVIGQALAPVWLVASPLRKIRDVASLGLPEPVPVPADES